MATIMKMIAASSCHVMNGDGVRDLVTPTSEDASWGAPFDPNKQVYLWDAFDPASPYYKNLILSLRPRTILPKCSSTLFNRATASCWTVLQKKDTTN